MGAAWRTALAQRSLPRGGTKTPTPCWTGPPQTSNNSRGVVAAARGRHVVLAAACRRHVPAATCRRRRLNHPSGASSLPRGLHEQTPAWTRFRMGAPRNPHWPRPVLVVRSARARLVDRLDTTRMGWSRLWARESPTHEFAQTCRTLLRGLLGLQLCYSSHGVECAPHLGGPCPRRTPPRVRPWFSLTRP